jgi:aspartyl/asparaginyl beta-hydroxylase (cupin superfamily)
MIIHTFVYNKNNITLPSLPENSSYIKWEYQTILDLIKNKYSEWEVYFKRLILNKSRENLIKYIVVMEYGGVFINIELLKLFTTDHMLLISEYYQSFNFNSNSKYEMIFWMEKSNQQDLTLTMDILDVDEFIINNDIFIIKNSSNSFVKYLLEQIDKTIIPINEYQNKIYLGNIFMGNFLSKFYQSNFNIKLTNKNSFFNNWFGFGFGLSSSLDNLESLYKNDSLDKFEKSIYFVELNKDFPFDSKYKLKIYPNVPDLSCPEKTLNSWEKFYKIKNYVENMLVLIIFQQKNLILTFILICLITIINYYFKEYLKATLDIKIGPGQTDSKIFFYPGKYKFFKQLKKSWKIIRDEAINIMENSPKLNISRTINDWHDSKSYFETIRNKEGWIRSWSYEPEDLEQNSDGNYEWLNYGLLYFGVKFDENVKKCPKTFELLDKISPHINICGFSWMFGNCLLQPHTDITGLTSGSLAMHLGLLVPKPDNTCRLIIKNEDQYFYMNESDGKMFIFDATWEHYAYNLSNQDRLILYVDFKTI